MKPTDFSKNITDFLSKYLPGERGLSTNTIESYKTTFILFITFMEEKQKIPVNRLAIKNITKENIIAFLEWLQSERHCGTATRNVRLAALHSFFRYLQYEMPENLNEWQKILSIKAKKTTKKSMNYLTADGIQLLLEQPDQSTKKGRRDLAMLSLMYDCAARVQEIIDLTPAMIRLTKPYTIKIVGKGNKPRIVPLMEQQVVHLKSYLAENKLLESHANFCPLFFNSRNEKLTRQGVANILQTYANIARNKDSKLIPKLSPHSLRHSKAMHLLQAGVNLVYIRDILGHESVLTTEIYARADSKQKREAIESAYVGVVNKESPLWIANDNLLTWLKDFK
jgi:site-specific recombinase XerD